MPKVPDKKEGIKYLFLLLLALFMSQAAGLFFLFILPLGLIYRRWGIRGFLPAGVLLVIAFTVRGVVDVRSFGSWLVSQGISNPEAQGLFLALEIGVPICLLAAVFLLLAGDMIKIAGVYRLLLGVALTGILGFAVFPRVFGNAVFMERMRETLLVMGQVVTGGGEMQGGLDEALAQSFFSDPETVDVIKTTWLRTFSVAFEVLILFLWYLIESIAGRFGRASSAISLKRFVVPQNLLWPVIGLWILILASLLIPLGVLDPVIWNAGLALLLIYGIQGLGIIQAFLDRWQVRRGLQLLLLFVFASLLLQPGIGLVLMIVVPVLGISETWVKYRKN